LRLLTDKKLASELRVNVPPVTKATEESLKEIHVIVLKSRTEGRQLIGFKHINGTHKWDSYAKARFAADWFRKERSNGTTLSDIAKSLGDRHDTVLRLVQGIFVLDQAKKEELFDPEERYPGRVFFFSHLYTALARPEFRTFLELPKQWRNVAPVEDPVPKQALPKLKELLLWLFGSAEDETPPVIVSQNPDLRILGEVISTDTSLQRIRVDRDLKKAYERSGARSKQFSEHVIKSLSHLEEATAISYVYKKDATIREAVENIATASKHLLAQVRMKDTEPSEEEMSDEEPDPPKSAKKGTRRST